MGSADIIPGVSGGTIALITGIYDRLINAVRSVNKKAIISLFTFRIQELFETFHWRFVLILFCGILTAVIFFTRIVPLQVYMFTDPELIYGLFFGLILGSVFVLLKEIRHEDRGFKTLTPLVLGTLFGYWVVTLVPTDTPETFWFVFSSGILAFCALIVPGISGSYILLILGKYDYVLSNLGLIGNEQTLEAAWALLPLFLGGAVGLAFFSRILSWLLRHYHMVTLMVLIGFLIGSLYVIWPYQERDFREDVVRIELYEISDPLVQSLKAETQDTNRPSYLRLGEIVSPEDETTGPEKIEVETVTRTMVTAQPFIPELTGEKSRNEYSLWGGIFGLITGLILVSGIDYLRVKK